MLVGPFVVTRVDVLEGLVAFPEDRWRSLILKVRYQDGASLHTAGVPAISKPFLDRLLKQSPYEADTIDRAIDLGEYHYLLANGYITFS